MIAERPHEREAADLASLGFAVCEVAAPLPDGTCSCRLRDECPSPGKHPIGRHWLTSALARRARPTFRLPACARIAPANSYGLIPPPGSGLIVIDADEPDAELLALIPATLTVRRASAPEGRGHYYLRLPTGAPEDDVPRVFSGGEVRVAGSGHVVGPGCRHVSGDTYATNGLPVAVATPALLDALRDRPPLRADGDAAGGTVGEGDRHAWLVGQARKMAGWGWDADRIADALHEMNEEHCVPPLSERAMEPDRMAAWAAREIRPDRGFTVRRVRRAAPESRSVADKVILTKASAIPIRPVKWLWDSRVAIGSLALLAGREGIGKSTLDCWIAARVTRGDLPGELYGRPRSVVYIATEDDWSTTLAPRLLAAGADLERIYKVGIRLDGDERESQLYLPEDFGALDAAMGKVDPALVVLSPLMSRVSGALDSHRDQQVRQALEPLVEMAERRRACFLGLIHLNKTATTDPLRAVMASAAFVAVARAVLFVTRDPDDPDVRVVGQPKNNLGKTDFDLGLLTFTIEERLVGRSPEGELVHATRLRWGRDREGTIEQLLDDAATPPEARTLSKEVAEWLVEYLRAQGGEVPYQQVLADGTRAGFELSALQRGRRKAGVGTRRTQTIPSTTVWRLPGPRIVRSSRTPKGDKSEMSEMSAMGTHRTHRTHRDRRDARGLEPGAEEGA